MEAEEPGEYWAALDAWADAVDGLWETEACPSPGGWRSPTEAPQGMVPRLDRMPWWVRVWYHTPFLDQPARRWMWSRGGFDVLPPSVALPPQPQPPPAASTAASIELPLTGERVRLAEMRWEDLSPGLVHTVGGSCITRHRRRLFNEPWASQVYGVRPTPDPVSVWFSRTRMWRRVRKPAEVVYGPEGLWGAEILRRWDVVEVAYAGQTHSIGMGLRRLGWAPRTPRAQTGDTDIIYEP